MAYAFDSRLRTGSFGFFTAERFGGFVFFRFGDAFVARFAVFFYVIDADAVDFVVRIFQVDVWNQDDVDIQTLFHRKQLGAFFVQQEGSNIDRHLCVYFAGVVFHRFFLNDAQHVQGGGFDAADDAGTGTARTRNMAAFAQSRFQTLAAQFQKSETRKFAHLHAGAVFFERVAQDVFNIALVFRIFHVDEVDDDQTAQVAQAHLTCDLFSGFHIGFERGVFNIRAACGARRVDVDGNQGFGVVDHNRTAGRQADAA